MDICSEYHEYHDDYEDVEPRLPYTEPGESIEALEGLLRAAMERFNAAVANSSLTNAARREAIRLAARDAEAAFDDLRAERGAGYAGHLRVMR